MDDRVVGELGPLPAGVAVHRVVAAADGGDAAGLVQPALQLLQVARAAVRQRVAAVGEGVEDDVGHALLGGELDRRLDVLPAGVDAAVGDQAEQVQAAARAAAGALAGGEQRLVLEEAAVGDGVVDPGQVLLDDRAGAEVEVADLGVAHLPLGQADVGALGGELGVRELAQRRSKTGVSASEIALPGPGSASPQPSRMIRASEGTSGLIGSAGGLDDRGEVLGVEAGAADQGAVDVGQREQLGGVGRA